MPIHIHVRNNIEKCFDRAAKKPIATCNNNIDVRLRPHCKESKRTCRLWPNKARRATEGTTLPRFACHEGPRRRALTRCRGFCLRGAAGPRHLAPAPLTYMVSARFCRFCAERAGRTSSEKSEAARPMRTLMTRGHVECRERAATLRCRQPSLRSG